MANTPRTDPDLKSRLWRTDHEVLSEEIARLPPGQRLVFTMRHREGLKLSQIATARLGRG